MLPLAQGVDRQHLFQSVPVAGDCKRHRIVFILLPERPGGHNQHLIRNGGFGDMQLAAFDNDAVFQPLFDIDVGTGIGLIRRTQQAIPFDVRLGTAANEIFLLKTEQPFLEVFMIAGFTRLHLVRFKRYVIDGVGGVDAHAALDAAADLLAEHAGHVLLAMQVFGVLMDMGEPVDALPRQVGNRRHEIPIFRPFRLVVRGADGVETAHLQLIGAVDQLAVIIKVALHFGEPGDVILFASHVLISLFLKFFHVDTTPMNPI